MVSKSAAFFRDCSSISPRIPSISAASLGPYLKPLQFDNDYNSPRNHSSKGVWTFELASRAMGDVISWETPVRIRHVNSGCYLAVDMSRPVAENQLAESWYPVAMVDGSRMMHAHDGETHQGYLGFEESTVFYLLSNEATSRSALPASTVSVRVEHRYKRPGNPFSHESLYLHDTGTPKPLFSGSDDVTRMALHQSLRLCFSDERHTADVFLVNPLENAESMQINQVLSAVPVAKLYAHMLEDKHEPLPLSNEVLDEIDMLINTINDCNFGAGVQGRNKDWVKESQHLLPSEFANLFKADPHEKNQRLCRETKLMDAVLEMTLAPYNRFILNQDADKRRPFAAGRTGKRVMAPVRTISKLAYVALQRMFHENESNQMYFSARHTVVKIRVARSPKHAEARKKAPTFAEQTATTRRDGRFDFKEVMLHAPEAGAALHNV